MQRSINKFKIFNIILNIYPKNLPNKYKFFFIYI